jgi:hypothetical protein
MDYKKLAALKEKYWKGETSIEEEQLLFNEQATSLDETKEEAQYFNKIKQFRQLSLETDFTESFINEKQEAKFRTIRKVVPAIYWQAAAAILLVLSFYFIFPTVQETKEVPVIALEEDPEAAFEVTKQALLLISTKLNKASEVTTALDKFGETQAKIKVAEMN